MFRCLECGSDRQTRRGLCRECWPEGHAEVDELFALFASYESVTGRRVLDDYDAFERWGCTG